MKGKRGIYVSQVIVRLLSVLSMSGGSKNSQSCGKNFAHVDFILYENIYALLGPANNIRESIGNFLKIT